MSITLKVEAGNSYLENGKYNAEIKYIELFNGKFGQSVKFGFIIYGAEKGEIEVTAMTSAKLTPNTKLGRWCSILSGEPITVNQDIDIEQFVGCHCQVYAENTTKENGAVYSNVKEITKLLDVAVDDDDIPF